jgi:hypothetical protein
LTLVLLACSAHAALAMHIRNNRRELARSPDGAVLYELRADGPEGGGSLTYRVEGKSRRDGVDFVVSSDFSPGNGSTPQTVSAKICEERLAALGAKLTKRKIPGVTLHPEGCRSKDRSGIVVTK